jgi:hypothetical protein
MDREEGTTKYAEGAKREATLLFKDKSFKIVGDCFEVYKEKGTRQSLRTEKGIRIEDVSE